MKQKYLMAVLAAGMLVLAGCGGGGGFSQQDIDDARAEGLAEGMESAPPGRECPEGFVASAVDDTKCDPDPGHMSPEDMAEASREAMALNWLLGTRIATDTTVTPAATLPALFNGAKDADKGSEMITVDGPSLSLTDGALTIDSEALRALSKSPEFGDLEAKEHDRPQGSTLQDLKVRGEHNGIPGEFTCSGDTACTSQNNRPKAGTWSFKPDDPDAKTRVDHKWGWWVTRHAAATATAKANDVESVNFFRGIPGAATSASLASEGTATYTGTAVGLYSVPGDSGDFTANASLTATFKNTAGATIKGSLDNFMGSDGEGRNWMVTLKESGDVTNNEFSGDTVWAIDGNPGSDSAWVANTYNGTAEKVPDTVMGEFHALHQSASMIGTFGATRQ